jgi:modulator of FtsH protease
MTSGDLAGWSTFFATAAESSATLAGLVMVAISVNVRQIIAYKHLPSRAAAAIGALCLVLVSSLLALIPQPPHAFAVEIDLVAGVSWVMHIYVSHRIIEGHREIGRSWRDTFLSLSIGQAQIWPLTFGAVLLTLGDAHGLYGLALTVCTAFLLSALNGWVLLIQILR